jgi:phosphoglycolate phosphatase
MIKAIIFDLDGTLLNTIEDIQSVLNESLKAYSLPEVSLQNTKLFVGDGAKKLVERAVGERQDMFDKVYAYYSKRFSECGNEKTTLYEGESETLTKLKQMGIKLAILTNKPQKATQNVYKKYLSSFNFDVVRGQTDLFPLKPNKQSALNILDELNVKPSECLFIGDGEADVLTAKNAGIKCISVLWGYRSKEQLQFVGATDCIQHYYDILSYIS